LLFGFDMRTVDGRRHFFGDHPDPLNRPTDYRRWFREFDLAAKRLPNTVEIINCTPGSALPSFPRMELRPNDAGARFQGAAFGLCRR
jgi:hypothetical protein